MESTDNDMSFAEANAALEKIGYMAEELEFKSEYYLNEIQKLADEKDRLREENDDLVHQLGYIIAEEREARRSFTAFQIAVSIFIFLYGTMYGRYSC